jgi:hypothetical protein
VFSFLPTFPQNPCSPHLYYMPCPHHSAWLDHSNYTWWRVRVTKRLIV